MSSRNVMIATWLASGLLAALYLFASYPKLMSDPQAVDGFHKFGYSDGFRMFIGSCELLGAIALLVPRLAFWSACGLFIIMLGAAHAHLTHDEASHLPVVVIALVLLAFVASVRRQQALLLS
ncbi:MAG TPA: DoxX family protein [Myxococcota bacterium]|nr:DoxX family protein [Myxococcota bacterium]